MRHALMLSTAALILFAAETGSGSGAPPAPKKPVKSTKPASKPKAAKASTNPIEGQAPAAPTPPPSTPTAAEAPKPASAETVAKTTGQPEAAPEPKQSKDGPPVVAAVTEERDGAKVEATQVEGFAPAVEHVDGEDGSNGDPSNDPALAVEPGQAIDQSGGNPVAQNLTTAHGAIDVSPKVQANGRYAEAGPDHGDLPPDPTMASEAIHAKVQEVRDAAAEGERNVAAGREGKHL